jgi:predicted RNase H-like HicB family nuclease
MLRQAVADEKGTGLPSLSHRLPLVAPDCVAPVIFLVTCRELPDGVLFAADEEEALARAELAINQVLAARGPLPEVPS